VFTTVIRLRFDRRSTPVRRQFDDQRDDRQPNGVRAAALRPNNNNNNNKQAFKNAQLTD